MPMVYISDQALLELEKYRLQVNRETGIACDRSQAIERLLKLPCPAEVVVISTDEDDDYDDKTITTIHGVLSPEKAKEVTGMYPSLDWERFNFNEVQSPYDKPPVPKTPRYVTDEHYRGITENTMPEVIERMKHMIAEYEKNHPNPKES